MPSSSLYTKDISGANAGSRLEDPFVKQHNRERRNFRESNNTKDIDGAFTGSLKKAP